MSVTTVVITVVNDVDVQSKLPSLVGYSSTSDANSSSYREAQTGVTISIMPEAYGIAEAGVNVIVAILPKLLTSASTLVVI